MKGPGRHFVVFDFFAPLDGQFFFIFFGASRTPKRDLERILVQPLSLVSRGVAPEGPDVERLG